MPPYASAVRLPFADWFNPAEPEGDPARQLAPALAAAGCRFQRDGDELVHRGPELEARLAFADSRRHTVLKLSVVIPESRLLVGASSLLDEMALEGLPVVAMGYGCGTATWEFRWSRATGHSWREHARRCVELVDRLRAAIRH
jgi:hypothetical protein